MSYKKEIDYQSKINEAVEKGDYKSAAEFEKSRNEKIIGENLNYETTNKYQGWLDNTDYGTILEKKISSGAPKESVESTLKKRVEKASNTEGLQKYAYDDIYDKAVKYLMGDNSFSERPVYENSYESKIESLINELLNGRDFSYNPYSDDLYKYYLDAYHREGRRAMENTLGEVSANTGGVASSYAATAANQAYNYYAKKAADIIPELYSDAYDRYNSSFENDLKKLSALLNLSESEYERFNKDREFDYKVYKDEKERTYNYDRLDWEMEESDRDYEAYLKKLEIDENESLRESAIDKALKKWDLLGYLDSESASILGLPSGLYTSDYIYKMYK